MVLSLGKALWIYRGFILGNVKREFQSTYRNSLFGAIWTVLQPLALILVYTLVFSALIRPRISGMNGTFAYSIYLCAGIVTWTLFQEILMRCTNVFLENGTIIQKLDFPRICLPAILVLNALINFGIILGIYLVFLIAIGQFPGWIIFSAVPIVLVEILFATGLGVITGTLNVFFRDVGQFINVIMQFWFWLTPIVYSKETLPDSIQSIISINPMVPLVSAYHQIFLYHRSPDYSTVWPVALLSIGLCVAGVALFRRQAGEMVDEL